MIGRRMALNPRNYSAVVNARRIPGFRYAGFLVLGLFLSGCMSTPPVENVAPPKPAIGLSPPSVPAANSAEQLPPVSQETTRPVNHENNIYFALGATNVDQAGENKLREHAARLKEDPKLLVTLIGLTDNSGSRSVNLLIAEQRVDAVAKRLRSYGVQNSQIRRYPLGSKTADESCNTAACRQIMRRVELSYPVTAR